MRNVEHSDAICTTRTFDGWPREKIDIFFEFCKYLWLPGEVPEIVKKRSFIKILNTIPTTAAVLDTVVTAKSGDS